MPIQPIHSTLMFAALLVCASAASGQSYNVQRDPGTAAFGLLKCDGTSFMIHEDSTLKTERILLNNPTDNSVQLMFQTLETRCDSAGRGFVFGGTTALEVQRGIKAIEVRTIVYDVFGEHLKTLSNYEARDFLPGEETYFLIGTWRAADADVAGFLTSVTYVARIRFEDGLQWKFDRDKLEQELSGLGLTIDEDAVPVIRTVETLKTAD